MDELFKALRHFITREFAFILGGAIVLAVSLYCLNWLPTKDTPITYSILALGISYVLGFMTHGVARISNIVRATSPRTLPKFVEWLYSRYKNKDWHDIPDNVDFWGVRDSITSERVLAEFDRIVTMKLYGTVVGPSCLISSVILLGRSLRIHNKTDLLLAIVSAISGLLLIAIGWIKVAEQAAYLNEINKRKLQG